MFIRLSFYFGDGWKCFSCCSLQEAKIHSIWQPHTSNSKPLIWKYTNSTIDSNSCNVMSRALNVLKEEKKYIFTMWGKMRGKNSLAIKDQNFGTRSKNRINTRNIYLSVVLDTLEMSNQFKDCILLLCRMEFFMLTKLIWQCVRW